MRVSRGVATLLSKGQYEAQLTLVQGPSELLSRKGQPKGQGNETGEGKRARGNDSNWWWRLVDLNLIAGIQLY